MGCWFRGVLVCTAYLTAVLYSRVAAAAISVQVTAPSDGSLQAGPLDVMVGVNSTFQLQSVAAQVDAVSTNLTYMSGTTWAGSLPLTNVSLGQKTLTVTATDVYGATGAGIVTFRYRHPPTVMVDEPVWGQLVGATVRVRARCIDENPSTCTVTAQAGPSPTMALGQVDALLGVTPGWRVLYVNVTNDANQTGGGEPLYIYSAPSLLGLRAVGCAPGQILDFDSARLLYRLRNDIHVADRRTGQTTLLFPQLSLCGPSSIEPTQNFFITYLGSNNVLFAYDPDNSRSQLWYDVWRGGTTLPEVKVLLGSNKTFAVGGDRAAHVAVNSSSRVAVTDLTNGTDVDLPETSITAGPLLVTPSGTVYYSISFGGGVGRWANGVTTHLTNQQVLPVASDDINLVLQNFTTYQFDVLPLRGDADAGVPIPIDQGPVLAAGGWLAFSRVPDAGPAQVWSRSPAGVVAQVSYFGAGASAEALSDTGEVVMRTGNERWIGRAGVPPTQVAPDGTIRWWNGQWYVTVARMMFRLASSCTPSDPECGSQPDGGPFQNCPAFEVGDGGPGGGDVDVSAPALDDASIDVSEAGPDVDASAPAREDASVDVSVERGSPMPDASADADAPADASIGPAGDGAGDESSSPPGESGCGGCRILSAKPHGGATIFFVVALATLARVRSRRDRPNSCTRRTRAIIGARAGVTAQRPSK